MHLRKIEEDPSNPQYLRTLGDSYYPNIQRFIDQEKKHDMGVMFHSCGAIRPLSFDSIEMGVDILNPIQTTAKGMIPWELKEAFGRELCFHGSIDTQHALPFGTPEDVAAEVRDRIKALAAEGLSMPPHRPLPPTCPSRTSSPCIKRHMRVDNTESDPVPFYLRLERWRRSLAAPERR